MIAKSSEEVLFQNEFRKDPTSFATENAFKKLSQNFIEEFFCIPKIKEKKIQF